MIWKLFTHPPLRAARDDLAWLSPTSLPPVTYTVTCDIHCHSPARIYRWRLLFRESEADSTCLLCGVLSLGVTNSVFHLNLFLPTVVRLWRRGISTGILSASCAQTVTSTSNRRATSSWRGSCTVKLTQEPARGPRRDTTWLLCIPKLKQRQHRQLEHARMHAPTHIHTPSREWLWAGRWQLSTPNLKPRLLDIYCVRRERNGRQMPTLWQKHV